MPTANYSRASTEHGDPYNLPCLPYYQVRYWLYCIRTRDNFEGYRCIGTSISTPKEPGPYCRTALTERDDLAAFAELAGCHDLAGRWSTTEEQLGDLTEMARLR